MWACYKNRADTVRLLLDHHAHANTVDEEDGLTPLIVAAGRGHEEVVHNLLVAGAAVNSSDKFGNTALIWAARKGSAAIVEVRNQTRSHCAVENGYAYKMAAKYQSERASDKIVFVARANAQYARAKEP